ncbi:MAG: hypothetical protein GY732_08460 [Gammaproteobacteria bacterium]|nr:hypothetical protein [Gammaproteobacteria bacterium]
MRNSLRTKNDWVNIRCVTSTDLGNSCVTSYAPYGLEHRSGATLVLAMRGWQFGLFQPFFKDKFKDPGT